MKTGSVFPDTLPSVPTRILESNSFFTNKLLTLFNGDICIPGDWVLIRNQDGGAPGISCIREILTQLGTENANHSGLDAILVQKGKILPHVDGYHMPQVRLEDLFVLLPIQVCHILANSLCLVLLMEIKSGYTMCC
jgi:hypothetical protein